MTPESTMHSSTPCAWAAGSARSGCPARDARVGVVYGRAVGSSADATAAKARSSVMVRVIIIIKFRRNTGRGGGTNWFLLKAGGGERGGEKEAARAAADVRRQWRRRRARRSSRTRKRRPGVRSLPDLLPLFGGGALLSAAELQSNSAPASWHFRECDGDRACRRRLLSGRLLRLFSGRRALGRLRRASRFAACARAREQAVRIGSVMGLGFWASRGQRSGGRAC